MGFAPLVFANSLAVNKIAATIEYEIPTGTEHGIVKRVCLNAGYNPHEFGGHSLRAGLATQATANGVPERLIMRQTRH